MTDEPPRAEAPHGPARPLPMCPMGAACRRMMEKPPSRLLMFLPGCVFIAVGILIVLAPGILVWLIAAALILMGIAMLGGAYFMRSVAERMMAERR